MLDNVGLRYPHRASGTKAPRTLRPLPLLRFAVSATGGAHLCSIQYYLRFWLGSCRTSLAVSALRIMRYCLYHEKDDLESILCAMLVTLTTCITITGWKFRFGSKPFEVGQKVRLVKEPDNEYADCQKTLVGASIARPCPFACEKTYPEKALLRQVDGRPMVAPTYLIGHECDFSTRRSMSRS